MLHLAFLAPFSCEQLEHDHGAEDAVISPLAVGPSLFRPALLMVVGMAPTTFRGCFGDPVDPYVPLMVVKVMMEASLDSCLDFFAPPPATFSCFFAGAAGKADTDSVEAALDEEAEEANDDDDDDDEEEKGDDNDEEVDEVDEAGIASGDEGLPVPFLSL